MNVIGRFEFKYILDEYTAREIETFIEKVGFMPDPRVQHTADGHYIVTSLYFDSPYFGDYYEKVDGLLDRKKVRARVYPDAPESSDHVWLEIKRKHDMYVSKHRLRIGMKSWRTFRDQLLERGTFYIPPSEVGNSPGNHRILKDLERYVTHGAMRPHLVVRYRRRPYVGFFQSPLRITFDSRIQAWRSHHLHTERTAVPFEKERVIMEVKFNGNLPLWFNQLVQQFELKREKYSKYTEAVNAVYEKELFTY
jgi:hypothetical protein